MSYMPLALVCGHLLSREFLYVATSLKHYPTAKTSATRSATSAQASAHCVASRRVDMMADTSTLKVHFMWGIRRNMMALTSRFDEERAMSLADVRSMLEHYLDWA